MSIVNRVKAGLSAASAMLSGKKAAVKEKLAAELQPVETQQEEPVKPVRKSRKKVLTEVLQNFVAEMTPARRIGSNSKLSLPEQEKIQQAAVAKRERRMKRSNGWSAS